MFCRPLLLVCFSVLVGSAGRTRGQEESPQARHPNFVVILIDDLGWSDLGCYGSTDHLTPNLDRLATRGVRFTQGYASCPVCSPTRAAIMTGRSPARLHLTDWLPGRGDRPDQPLKRPVIRQALPLEEVTLAEALKGAGYTSAAMGKWHLGEEDHWPRQQGFDINLGGTQTGSPPKGYFNFITPSLQAAGPDEYLTDRLNEEAVAFIRQHKERPFFLYLSHYAVHIPLQAKPGSTERYEKAERKGPQYNPTYSAMLQSVDDGVGMIEQALDEEGIAERTIVVFTSDNGGLSVREGPLTPATANVPLRAGKGYLYEGGIRVPWIWVWPGKIAPGTTSEVPIVSTDLLPTLLDLAGVPAPAETTLDGVSLKGLLLEQKALARDALFWHYPHYSNQGGKPGGAVRKGKWKLLQHYEDSRTELYDISADPPETRELSDQNPRVAQELVELLEAWRKQVDAQMPTPNPEFGAKP